MAKKFKFKLEGLLKLREFNEKKAKIELGNILREITSVENEISELNAHIKDTYHAQKKTIENKASGQLISFFPSYIEGKRQDIKAKENLIFSLKKKYARQLEDLKGKRGETKVIESLKDKHKEVHKKEVERKENLEREENILIRLNRRVDL